MATIPPFLQALELDVDADERAIRRAYAKRLKLIDAEADPAAFQSLRDIFESALKWAELRARHATATASQAPTPTKADESSTPAHAAADAPADAPAPATAPAPAASDTAGTPVEENPGERVFAEFVARLTGGVDDEAAATAQIADALADARLVNLETRSFFEWRVACLIVNGWRPGHEFLFKPACDAFSWEVDRRRLAVFGQVGAIMDAAIRERLIFLGQPAMAQEMQRKLIRRLRTEKPSSIADLASEIPMLSMLIQRYPHWMRAMTRQEVVQHWIDTWNALSPEQRQAATPSRAATQPTPTQPFQPQRRSAAPAATIWVVLAVLGGLSRLAAWGISDSHAIPPTSYYQGYAQPAPAPVWSRPEATAPKSTFPQTPGFENDVAPLGTTNYFPDVLPSPSPSARDVAAAKALADATARARRAEVERQRALPPPAQQPDRVLPKTRYDYSLGLPDPTAVPVTGYGNPGSSNPPSSPGSDPAP